MATISLSADRLEEFIRAELSYFSVRQLEPLTLKRIVMASTPGRVAKMVHDELPVRFAQRVKLIEAINGWEEHDEMVAIHDIFLQSFRDLRMADPKLFEDMRSSDLQDFTNVIYSVRRRHTAVTALVGEAMRKIKWMDSGADHKTLQAWADKFLASRISTEMLTSHYIAIIEASGEPSSAVGIVDTKCNPGQICEAAAEEVRKRFEGQEGAESLSITVRANSCMSNPLSPIEFSYIPRYLFYMVIELLLNSVHASVQASKASTDLKSLEGRCPPITITVCADQRHVAIRISDHGGGVPFGNDEKIWSYQFSTSAQPFEVYVGGASPLSGWGMGLPLSRLYAEYLGGSLEHMNMPGIGVDSYLFLKRISLDVEELASVSI